MATWTELANATLAMRDKVLIDTLARKRLVMAMLNQRGNLRHNIGGEDWRYPMRVKDLALQTFTPGDDLDYARHNTLRTCVLPWRQYYVSDAMTEKDILQNQYSPAQLVNLWADRNDICERSWRRKFPYELIVRDGNATATSDRVHGLESLFAQSGAAADGIRRAPADTYAGHSTAWGTFGGTTEADDEYTCYSPTIVDVTAANFAATGTTWADTCLEALNFGITEARSTNEQGENELTIILCKDWYRKFVLKLESLYQLNVERGSAKSKLVELGFEATRYNGADVTWDVDVPDNTGYGIPFSDLVLGSLQPKLIRSRSFFREENLSFRWMTTFYGNLKIAPVRGMVKWAEW